MNRTHPSTPSFDATLSGSALSASSAVVKTPKPFSALSEKKPQSLVRRPSVTRYRVMGFFTKKPTDKLRKQYKTLMEQAMQAQRGGDIVKSSEIHAEAEALLKKIEAEEK